MSLKTKLMAAENSAFHIQIKTVIFKCYNTSKFYCVVYQINTVIVSKETSLKNIE